MKFIKSVYDYIKQLLSQWDRALILLSSGVAVAISFVIKDKFNYEVSNNLIYIYILTTFLISNFLVYRENQENRLEIENTRPNLQLYFYLLDRGQEKFCKKIIIQVPVFAPTIIDKHVEKRRLIWDEYDSLFKINNPVHGFEDFPPENYKIHYENKKLFDKYLEEYERYLRRLYHYVVNISKNRLIRFMICNEGNSDTTGPTRLRLRMPEGINFIGLNIKSLKEELILQLKIHEDCPQIPEIEDLKTFINYSINHRQNLQLDRSGSGKLRDYFGYSAEWSYDIVNFFDGNEKIPIFLGNVGDIDFNENLLQKIGHTPSFTIPICLSNEVKNTSLFLDYEIYNQLIPGGIKNRLEIDILPVPSDQLENFVIYC